MPGARSSELRPPDRRLLDEETEVLRSVFGPALDLEPVRIRYGGLLTVGDYARTVGNLIAFPRRYRDGLRTLKGRCWLVHEATHLWQNQVLGKRYIPGAIWEHITLANPYHFELFPERPFLSYGYEAQASLVAELYLRREVDPVGPERNRLEQLLAELLSHRR